MEDNSLGKLLTSVWHYLHQYKHILDCDYTYQYQKSVVTPPSLQISWPRKQPTTEQKYCKHLPTHDYVDMVVGGLSITLILLIEKMLSVSSKGCTMHNRLNSCISVYTLMIQHRSGMQNTTNARFWKTAKSQDRIIMLSSSQHD